MWFNLFVLYSVLLELAFLSTVSGSQRMKVRKGIVELNPSVQHIPLDPSLKTLRPLPPQVSENFDIFIGSSAFRDGFRCGRTFFLAISRATYPDRLSIGLVELIYEGDDTCLDEYCKLAEAKWPDKGPCPYKEKFTVETRSAADARGCTTARHAQQQLIRDEEFCLQVDAHSHFTNGWDEELLTDWIRADNEMAVLTTYPHSIYADPKNDSGKKLDMGVYPQLCAVTRFGNGLTMFPFTGMIYDFETPQLGPFWGGGLSFSKCHAERNVPADPHLPWLWDGEEFLRSAILWTYGYDMYSPSANGSVISHNYTKNTNQRSWQSSIDEETKKLETEMSSNRYRLQVGVPIKGQVDTFELDKYSFGKARSFSEFMAFTGISFEEGVEDSTACRQLHWVPYSNTSAVESIVSGDWKLQSKIATRDATNERQVVRSTGKKTEVGADNVMGTQTTFQSKQKDWVMTDILVAAPTWFLCGVLSSAIFMYARKANVLRAIRRRSYTNLSLKGEE